MIKNNIINNINKHSLIEVFAEGSKKTNSCIVDKTNNPTIYTLIDKQIKEIERENINFSIARANEDINFLFSSKPRMTTIKKEISQFIEGLK
jgi:hypothetical protein